MAGKIFELVKDGIFVRNNARVYANLLAEFLFEGYELRIHREWIQLSLPKSCILSLKKYITEVSFVKSWALS